jgi:hypothetical protein
MAMVDYGAIVWKDGKCVSTGMFDNMQEQVGWSDDGVKYYNEGRYAMKQLDGNYFAYIGDKYLTLAIYRHTICIYRKSMFEDAPPFVDAIYFGGYTHKIDFSEYAFTNSSEWHGEARVKVYKKPFHQYYVCKMRYGGHKYKIAFGYGVDYDYYKKTHIVDYYGTPWHKAKNWWHDFKHDVYWKFRELTGQVEYVDNDYVDEDTASERE